MNAALRNLLAPSGVWPLAVVLAVGIIVVARLTTPAAATSKAVDNPLVYADGESVPKGRWSAFCIDGVAYLEIVSPYGHAVVPKLRKNGLVERCAPPGGE
jgi:hypothetical protein